MNYIQYKGYDKSVGERWFENKQKFLRLLSESQAYDSNEARLNAILAKAQDGLTTLNQNLGEDALGQAIEAALGVSATQDLSQSLESMAGNISAYFADAAKHASVVNKEYENGYEVFNSLIQQTFNKGRVLVNRQELEQILSRLSPEKLQSEFNDVANPLGWIGELSGLALLSNIADELLESSFKGIPGVKAEIVNTGAFKTLDNQRLTTDNLLVIRDASGKVMFQLNLSNKLNTAYKSTAKTTGRPIKIRTTTVKSFLNGVDDNDWATHVYNTLSYHYDENSKTRVDYFTKGALASGMRQAMGTQILYDHIFGTRGEFNVNGEIFRDEVHLVAYGTKIVSTTSILKNALFTKYMRDKRASMAQVIGDRKSWFDPTGDWENGRSTLKDEFEAQRKINQFSVIYNQTLKLNPEDLRI